MQMNAAGVLLGSGSVSVGREPQRFSCCAVRKTRAGKTPPNGRPSSGREPHIPHFLFAGKLKKKEMQSALMLGAELTSNETFSRKNNNLQVFSYRNLHLKIDFNHFFWMFAQKYLFDGKANAGG